MKPGNKGKPKSRQRERKTRRRIGAREYKNYSQEMLELAVEYVGKNKLSARAAAKQFSIPKQTILNKVHKKHNKSVGCPTRLSAEEEAKIVKVLIAAANFGCPLTKLDLRLVVYEYLKKNDRQDLFEGQPPGKAWVDNFLLRNACDLTVRNTQNIKKARAEKSVDEFMTYFENLHETVKDVPASNILNFDETNLSDNPGNSKCIFKRGVKYPERNLNSSKAATSIMFSATAAGDILPVYVVYKADNVYSEWVQGGPRDARYNHTKSGWFDSQTFEDYFRRIVLDWASSLSGKKVVICDNLSSHLSVDVIELCESHDIHFVFLPANSTHLTQPLDVAFFGPVKKLWRKILLQYKMENPNQTTLNKNHFPKLLKSLTEQIQLTGSKNIKSGFKATGISPFNPREVLKRVPEYHEDLGSYEIDEALLDYLKQTRQPKPMNVRRNKKVLTEPGKSVTVTDFQRQVTNAPRSVAGVRGGVKTSKSNQTKKVSNQKYSKSHKLVDNDGNYSYEMDMILDERTELVERTDMDETQFPEDIFEDDVNEIDTFLDEKTGLLEMKGNTNNINKTKMDNRMMKVAGNKNNENNIKVLSSVTLTLPSTSTGRINQSESFFRPQDLYSDSDDELQNMDKENMLREVEVKMNNEKKERCRPLLSRENYKHSEVTEGITTTNKDKMLIQGITQMKTTKTEKNYGGNSKRQKECRRLARNSSGSETDVSENISYRESSDSETYVPEEIEDDIEMNTTEYNKTVADAVENEDLLDNGDAQNNVHVGTYVPEEIEADIEMNTTEYNKTVADAVENEDLLDNGDAQNNVHVGTYVLVKFTTKKSTKHYVGKVTKANGIFVSINFLRKKKNNTFSWPLVKDESEMYLFDIDKVLPKPTDGRRGSLKFDVDFSGYDVL